MRCSDFGACGNIEMETHVRYPTVSELIYINGTLLKKSDILAGTTQIRDIQLLEAAVARPAASAFGQDAYPTLNEKVAALMHSVARNHPFTDGNKRTATVGGIFMFRINGRRVDWQQDEALTMIVRLAEGQSTIQELAAWFPTVSAPATHEADADADMRLIGDMITEQKWLLNELERR
jgi:death-on-curing protein